MRKILHLFVFIPSAAGIIGIILNVLSISPAESEPFSSLQTVSPSISNCRASKQLNVSRIKSSGMKLTQRNIRSPQNRTTATIPFYLNHTLQLFRNVQYPVEQRFRMPELQIRDNIDYRIFDVQVRRDIDYKILDVQRGRNWGQRFFRLP